MRFFFSLLNAKSDMLDPDIPKRLPQHAVVSTLGIEPTYREIATAMKKMAKTKAVGPDGVWGYLGGRFDIWSLWGLYKMHETLWFYLVSV